MKQIIYFDDGTQLVLTSKPKDNYPVWIRIPHDVERLNMDLDRDQYIPNTGTRGLGVIRKVVRDRQVAMPEVYRLFPLHTVPLTKPRQLLWKGIMAEIDGTKWRSLLGSTLALTNNATGLGGAECHADYVNKRDLDCDPPAYDQPRVTGGALLKARKEGDRYYIETMVAGKPLPTPYELLTAKKHLWFYMTSISPTGRIQYPQRKGWDGAMYRIRVPLFTEQEVYLPADEVHTLGVYQAIEPNIVYYKG